MEKGVRRWVVDISEWNPSPHDFSVALSVLPQQEHYSITRFVRMEDRKQALVSRLLQYALVQQVLRIPCKEIVIKRTIEGKPYLVCDRSSMDFPNFNFNVSHHGDYVAIASEPLCLVGLDIVSCMTPCRETVPEFVQNFSSHFSSFEWNNIINAGTCDEILIEFYRYWCLKEAYVKAIGIGLACRLDKVEFHHIGWANIFVKIDEKISPEWRFWLFELGKRHWVSVAKGHPRLATESYKRTLTRSDFKEEDYNNSLYLPNAPFLSQTVEQLIAILFQGNEKLDVKQNA